MNVGQQFKHLASRYPWETTWNNQLPVATSCCIDLTEIVSSQWEYNGTLQGIYTIIFGIAYNCSLGTMLTLDLLWLYCACISIYVGKYIHNSYVNCAEWIF